jgi:hypothetical protein
MLDANKYKIIVGDTIEVITYGHKTKGFVLNHFITTRNVSSDEINVFSYMLIEKDNKIVFFTPKDTVNITRIVLTEKTKIPTKLNEYYHDKISKAEHEFKYRQYMFESRRIEMSFAFANSVVHESIFGEKKELILVNKNNLLL